MATAADEPPLNRPVVVPITGSSIVFARLSNEGLLRLTLAARRAAHDAPLNPYRLDADGHRWVAPQSIAWASRSREWMQLADEVDRRSLAQPVPDWDGDSRR